MTTKAKRIKLILPVPLPRAAIENFARQIPENLRRKDIELDFVGTRAGATWLDSAYEATLADAFVLDAGATAETEGYDAVCSFSTSDCGLAALRSRLKIPVVGAAQAAFSLATQLGRRFSIVTIWEPWRRDLVEIVARYGLSDRLASVKQINVPPNTHELLNGREDMVFAGLEAAAREAITQDGADLIVIGSTTLYQSHAHLESALPCPVINPGLVAYQTCVTLLDLNLTHSKLAYPSPAVVADNLLRQIPPVYEP